MKVVGWMGKERMQVYDLPDPNILNPRDAIVRITTTCICSSDLHLYDGLVPTLEQGDILGHEFIGEVGNVGPGINKNKLNVGDRRNVVAKSSRAANNREPEESDAKISALREGGKAFTHEGIAFRDRFVD